MTKSLAQKLQTPKIGKIEIAYADILRRSKQHVAFHGTNESHIVFSMQRKGSMHRNQMSHLQGGQVFFNRWPVSSIPWPQMMKVEKAVHDKVFLPTETSTLTLGIDDSGDRAERAQHAAGT